MTSLSSRDVVRETALRLAGAASSMRDDGDPVALRAIHRGGLLAEAPGEPAGVLTSGECECLELPAGESSTSAVLAWTERPGILYGE